MMAIVTKLEQECEFYRMKAVELEKYESIKNEIEDIIDNAMQQYSDIIHHSGDSKMETIAQYNWKALAEVKEKIEQLKMQV